MDQSSLFSIPTLFLLNSTTIKANNTAKKQLYWDYEELFSEKKNYIKNLMTLSVSIFSVKAGVAVKACRPGPGSPEQKTASVSYDHNMGEGKEHAYTRRGIVSGDDGSGKYLVWFGSYTGDSKHRETLRALRPLCKDVFKGS